MPTVEIVEEHKPLFNLMTEGEKMKPKKKIWYVSQAYDLTGENNINLFGNEEKATEFFNKLVDQEKQAILKGEHPEDLQNGDVCEITQDEAWFSGEIRPFHTDYRIRLSWQYVEVE